jgi:hypothetical protein
MHCGAVDIDLPLDASRSDNLICCRLENDIIANLLRISFLSSRNPITLDGDLRETHTGEDDLAFLCNLGDCCGWNPPNCG